METQQQGEGERMREKAARLAERDRELIRTERGDVRRWTAEAAIERARRERAGNGDFINPGTDIR
jgi:hypothetical protein